MMRRVTPLLLLVACYDPTIEGGNLRCSPDGECPDGYYCASDAHCWKTGEVPPAKAPTAPQGVRGLTGVRSATVQWFRPLTDGGSPITAYRVTVSPGTDAVTTAGDAASAVFSGLSDGATYTFTVVAINAVGESPAASTPLLMVPGTPFAPASVAAAAGVRSAIVTWHDSADHGSPVLSYTITATPGGVTVTAAGDASSAVVDGLADATAYVFTVTATNAVGDSASTSSAPVTTPGVPLPPSRLRAAAATGALRLSWAPPDSNGGSYILSYAVTIQPAGGVMTRPDAYSAIVTGLAAGTHYTVSVTASNAVGEGAPATAGPLAPL